MQKYNTIINDFIQYKHYLGYKYRTDKIVLNEIKEYLIENNIQIITKEVTENYARINSNLKPNTIARNMGVFRELCTYIEYQKGIECYQIPKKIYPQNHHNFTPYIFSKKEINTVYNNLDKPINNYHYSFYLQKSYPLIIKILYQSGMRVGEVLNLTINNYDYKNGVFVLRTTKNGQERNVAIEDKLNEEINCYVSKFNIKGKIFDVSKSSIDRYFAKLLKESNIKLSDNFPRLHDLRHTFVVHNIQKAMKNNIDLEVFLPYLQAQLGHQSLNALTYYFHLTNDILNIIKKKSEMELGYLIRKYGEYDE